MCEEDEDPADTIQRILTIIRFGTDEEEQPKPQKHEEEDDGLEDLAEEPVAAQPDEVDAEEVAEETDSAEVAEEVVDDDEDLDFV
jgi:hypothetical protein